MRRLFEFAFYVEGEWMPKFLSMSQCMVSGAIAASAIEAAKTNIDPEMLILIGVIEHVHVRTGWENEPT
jgi:hypothetical protein